MTIPVQFITYTTQRTSLALIIMVPLYFATLGFQLGWWLRYYVREHGLR